MELLIGLALIVLAVLIGAASYNIGQSRSLTTAVPEVVTKAPQPCPDCAQVMLLVGQLQADMQTCRAAVAEGIEHVDRVENRIRGTIKRARKELDDGGLESPGLDAEVSSLSLVDDAGVSTAPVPAVPTVVAEAQSSIPGVSPEQLRRVRGG